MKPRDKTDDSDLSDVDDIGDEDGSTCGPLELGFASERGTKFTSGFALI